MADINEEVRRHQTTIDWEHREECQYCWLIYDRLRSRYFPCLQGAYFHCEAKDKRARLLYKSINGVGAQYDCTLNTKWINLPRVEVAALILHTLIHIWQDTNGAGSKCGYHNKQFTTRSEELGIPSSPGRNCKVMSYSESFLALITSIDPNCKLPLVNTAQKPVTVSKTSYVKHTCRCYSVRAIRDAVLICGKCGQPMTVDALSDQQKASRN